MVCEAYDIEINWCYYGEVLKRVFFYFQYQVCAHKQIDIANDDVTVIGSSSVPLYEPKNLLSGGSGWKPVPVGPGAQHNVSMVINTDENDATIGEIQFNIEGISKVRVVLKLDDGVVFTTEEISPDTNVVTINFQDKTADEIEIYVTEDDNPLTEPEVGNFFGDACYHPLATTTVFVTLTTSGVTGSTIPITTSIPGGWSEWSPWTNCSTTCGLGTMTRQRVCEAQDELLCEGPYLETQPCSSEECPTTPNWTTWSPWSECDVSCGEGTIYRYRACDDPPPMPGQSGCIGEPAESLTCTKPVCACEWDMESFRTEFGYEPSDIVGWMEKDGISGPTSEDELVRLGDKVAEDATIYVDCNECTCEEGSYYCNTSTCAECTYTNWNEWSPCSKSCDVGQRNRSRTLMSITNIQTCTEPRTETEDCNTDLCPTPENWSTWTEWSNCTTNDPCTSGIRTRNRDCTSEPQTPCAGDPTDLEVCGDECEEPVNCTDGKVWVDCSNTCPQTCEDFRLIEYCTESDTCIPGCKCPDGFVTSPEGSCVEQSTCPCYTADGLAVWPGFELTDPNEPCTKCICDTDHQLACSQIEDCCDWDTWTSWGECSVTCGQGTRNRYRNQTTDGNCGSNMETENCTLDACPPGCVVNGTGYEYGEMISDDFCKECYCTPEVNYYCTNSTIAIVDGDWSSWSVWSGCSSSCQGGSRMRTRTCSDPIPSCGGAECPGDNNENELCNVNIPCCETTPYSGWSSCSEECGDGYKNRTRTYIDENEAAVCNEELEDFESCNYGDCNMTCEIESWGEWTPCSAECGMGTRTRDRAIISQEADCPTNLVETDSCYAGDCPCLTNQIWSNNSLCQQTCDERASGVNTTACGEPYGGCVCEEGLYLDDNDNCVNDSECDKCYDNNGTEIQSGTYDKPDDECYACECVKGEEVCNRKCDIPVCDDNEELSYDVPNACCPICKAIPDTCQMYSKTEYLVDETSGCVSEEEITFNYCQGSCGNSTANAVLIFDPSNQDRQNANCRCCTGIMSGTLKEVPVRCGLSDTQRVAYVAEITECKCNGCLSAEYPASVLPTRR